MNIEVNTVPQVRPVGWVMEYGETPYFTSSWVSGPEISEPPWLLAST